MVYLNHSNLTYTVCTNNIVGCQAYAPDAPDAIGVQGITVCFTQMI